MAVCSNCSGSNIEMDSAQGNSFCVDCGAVLEENTIVSEVTFSETSGGASVLQGKVSAPSYFGYNRRLNSSESREVTIANAKRKLLALASAIRMSDHHVDAAHRWFILALQHNFTKGRRSLHVAAACLYIVCRMERTSHMLLDFSDVLQADVFKIGGIFMHLVRLLNLDLPLVDPCLYVGRFAAKLELGTHTISVVNVALRLAARMNRDWISTGRKPAGISAACLLIASRLFGFHRTVSEISAVVRICDATLKKRIVEFSDTPSAELSLPEFEGIWLESEADPPAYTKARRATNVISLSEKKPVADHQQQQRRAKLTDFKGFDPNEEVSLSDLDDEEDEDLNGFLLEASEVQMKTQLWESLNADWIEKKQTEEETSSEEKPAKPKRKRTTTAATTINGFPTKTADSTINTSSPEEINPELSALRSEPVKSLVASKKLSSKINYSVLDDLFLS